MVLTGRNVHHYDMSGVSFVRIVRKADPPRVRNEQVLEYPDKIGYSLSPAQPRQSILKIRVSQTHSIDG